MHHPTHIQPTEAAIQLHDQVREFITSRFGSAIVASQVDYDFPVFILEKSQVLDVISALKTDPAAGYSFLTTMCGLHFPDNKGQEFGLMYQLHNLQRNHRIRIKTFMGEKDLEMPTLSHIFPTANWMEREAYDFYGFRFKGHPDLRRILNMDEMNYHPLRKEYGLEDASRDDKQDKYFGR